MLVSAPADGADLTVVYGVNDDKLTKDHIVVSNASCTTNCLAPVAAVMHNAVGIEHGFMTTIHSYTGDQPTLDTMHKDLYRARAAALNIIPTSTGAAKAIGLVLPDLEGQARRRRRSACRRRTSRSSTSSSWRSARPRVDEVNNAIYDGGEVEPAGGRSSTWTKEPLVSSDLNHDPHSATFAIDQTKVIGGTFVRVVAWYDNEWGFSNRMADTAVAMGKLG